MTDEQRTRWEQIKKDFLRNKAIGGDSADTGAKVVMQLADMAEGLKELVTISNRQQTDVAENEKVDPLAVIAKLLDKLTRTLIIPQPKVEVINQPVPGLDKILGVLAETIEGSILPLVRNMDKKLDIDLRNYNQIKDVTSKLRQLEGELKNQDEQKPPSNRG
jgi:hypothetical protein